jgi:uncharacterized protein
MKTVRVARLMLIAGLIGLAGCYSLGRTEPPQRHYVLGGDRLPENVTPSASTAGLTVGVRRLRLASYLEAPFLVVREEVNRISYAEFHRWGEPLGGGINRAVASHLAAQTPVRGVDVAPWPARERYDYLIQLHVERFEGVAPEDTTAAHGEVQMLVDWEIVRQQDGAVLRRGTTEHREPGWRVGDYPALVRSLDAGLNVLARDLTAGLAELASRRAENGAQVAGASSRVATVRRNSR